METVLAKNLVDSSAKAAFPTQQNFEKTNIENKKMFQNWFNSACRCFGLVDTNNWCYHNVSIDYQLNMAAPYTNSYNRNLTPCCLSTNTLQSQLILTWQRSLITIYKANFGINTSSITRWSKDGVTTLSRHRICSSLIN